MNQQTSPRVRSGASINSSVHIRTVKRDEVKSASQGRWKSILTSLGIPSQYLKKSHGPCPACGGTNRFRFDDKNGDGTFFCSECEPGDGFRLLMVVRGWTFQQTLNAVAGVLGIASGISSRTPLSVTRHHRPADEPVFDERKARNIDRLWNEAHAVSPGDPVDLYLRRTRNINLRTTPGDLRYHPNLLLSDDMSFRPGMVAAIRNQEGALVSVHRTYLTMEGKAICDNEGEKIKRPMPSPLPGITRGAVVRLFEPAELLGIGEGIETCLKAHILFRVPVWSGLNANGLVAAILPNVAREVWIFADNDRDKADTGHVASRSLARRLTKEGRHVRVIEPAEAGKDFADY